MVYRYISPDMKQRALMLLDKDWDLEDVVEVLGVSAKSIRRWEDKYEEFGRVDPPSVLRGRPRILSSAMTDDLHQLIEEAPSLFLDEIADWLAIYHDQPISSSALNDNLHDLGLTYKVLRKVAAERDDVARAEWLHNIVANFTADQMVFLDESSKDDRTILRKYGRAPRGEAPVDSVILDRGIRYSVLPALTLDGYIAVRVVEGSIDGAEFYDFVVNEVEHNDH